MFVSPSNPTGAVYPRDEVEAIGRWAVEHGIWVITDEIYEHLTYDDHEFTSMPVVVPELADRCVVLNGVAKTYAMTGWRVGWMIGPADVVKAAANLQSHQTSNVANVCQRAALAAVLGRPRRRGPDARGLRPPGQEDARPAQRHRRACPACRPRAPSTPSRPSRACSERGRWPGVRSPTTVELAEVILEEAKVAIVPGEAFGAPGYARLSFALGDDDLGEGVRRIGDLLAR